MTTYANWVAKAASLLVEEHDLERGDVFLVDLPSHWLGPVFLGAAWTAGLTVAFPSSEAAPNAVVCGPASLANCPRAGDLPGARLLTAADGCPLRRAAAAGGP